MSSAELSIDISRLVSRARSGEAINTSSEGEVLAARYPNLGMSPELIGKAISRAAAMMGLSLDGGVEATGSELRVADGEPAPALAHVAAASAAIGDRASSSLQVPAQTAPAEMAAASSAHPVLLAPAEPEAATLDAEEPASLGTAADGRGETFSLTSPVAAMRRAFFGA